MLEDRLDDLGRVFRRPFTFALPVYVRNAEPGCITHVPLQIAARTHCQRISSRSWIDQVPTLATTIRTTRPRRSRPP